MSDASQSAALPEVQAVAPQEGGDPYVLRGSASATVETIGLKHGDAFMVADARGDLPEAVQETGVFWHGMRFLRTCDLFLEGWPLQALSHSISDESAACQIDLSNPHLPVGELELYQGVVHVRRLLRLRGHRLTQTLVLTNFETRPVRLTVGLKLGADFRDIFEVRGMVRPARGELLTPRLLPREAVFSYRGLDGVLRETRLDFSPQADHCVNDGVFWDVELASAVPQQIEIVVTLHERGPQPPTFVEEAGPHDPATGEPSVLEARSDKVLTDNVFFNRLLHRGIHDLVMMCTWTAHGPYPYGGIPWYVAPFGRDGLITSMEFLPWYPEVARSTLAFLAEHQGTKEDDFTEEQPGRILHEFRNGEMANRREVPFIPYYGSVDATPLFLITLERYIRWSNDLPFLRALWPQAQAAAAWMQTYGDADGDTFLEYARARETGLVNQGWKDSWDAISHRDGSLAEGPIALCEVQAYAYAAYHAICYLAKRLGQTEQVPAWQTAAETLRTNFLRTFWWEEEQVFYLGLDGQKRPCAVVSSNAGQCLWTGIVPDGHAQAMMERLMRPDMYTEWGVRTLSTTAARYNPMSYHNGSVWPHDTALIGAGFARYGARENAGRLLGNLYGLSLYYEGARLPELFCGFPRMAGYGPTRYPVACAPQSWAAGAPFLLLTSMLGFEPDAEHNALTLHYPTIPDCLQIERIDMRDIRLGERRGHLRFERSAGGTAVTPTGASEIDVHLLLK